MARRSGPSLRTATGNNAAEPAPAMTGLPGGRGVRAHYRETRQPPEVAAEWPQKTRKDTKKEGEEGCPPSPLSSFFVSFRVFCGQLLWPCSTAQRGRGGSVPGAGTGGGAAACAG